MNDLFRTKNETWKRVQSNLLFIAAAELLIYNGGLVIKYPVAAAIDFFKPLVGEKYALYYNANPGTVGAFRGTLNHGNGFFHEIYGYEGSISAMILVTAAILWLIYRLNKNGKLV